MRLRRSRTSIKETSARLLHPNGGADGGMRFIKLTMAGSVDALDQARVRPAGPAAPLRHELSMAAALRV